MDLQVEEWGTIAWQFVNLLILAFIVWIIYKIVRIVLRYDKANKNKDT